MEPGVACTEGAFNLNPTLAAVLMALGSVGDVVAFIEGDSVKHGSRTFLCVYKNTIPEWRRKSSDQ